jgi:hypothetical protein
MGTIFMIDYSDSLDTIWSQLVYTEARLLKDPRAKDLAPVITKMLDRWETVSAGQRTCWHHEIVAQAGVDYEDEQLDETVDDVDHAIIHIDRDRESLRYRRYFPHGKAEIIRLGLETELDRVRTWPTQLGGESEKPLQKLGTRVATHLADGDAAVAERRDAVTATGTQRVREIVKLVEDVNGARRSLFGLLLQRGEEAKLDPSWAQGFFRKSTATVKSAKAKVAGTPEGGAKG